jgi:hypothetical protein
MQTPVFVEYLLDAVRHHGDHPDSHFDALIDLLNKLKKHEYDSKLAHAYIMYLRARLPPPKLVVTHLPSKQLWTIDFQAIMRRPMHVELVDSNKTDATCSMASLVVAGVQVASAGSWEGLAWTVLDSGAVTAAQFQVLLPYFWVAEHGAVYKDAWNVWNEYHYFGQYWLKDSYGDWARHPSCPWRLRVFGDLLDLFRDVRYRPRHASTLQTLRHDAATRAPALTALLRPALARGWYLHGWYGDMLFYETFDQRELRVGVVPIALLLAAGLSPRALLRQYLPGDIIWELALLCGAQPTKTDRKHRRYLQEHVERFTQTNHQDEGGYAWPLEKNNFPSDVGVDHARSLEWCGRYVCQQRKVSPKRLARAIGRAADVPSTRLAWAVGV